MARLVSEDVELGFHLCYGDWNHRHLKVPGDASVLTTIANLISQRVSVQNVLARVWQMAVQREPVDGHSAPTARRSAPTARRSP